MATRKQFVMASRIVAAVLISLLIFYVILILLKRKTTPDHPRYFILDDPQKVGGSTYQPWEPFPQYTTTVTQIDREPGLPQDKMIEQHRLRGGLVCGAKVIGNDTLHLFDIPIPPPPNAAVELLDSQQNTVGIVPIPEDLYIGRLCISLIYGATKYRCLTFRFCSSLLSDHRKGDVKTFGVLWIPFWFHTKRRWDGCLRNHPL